jgi:hypothetical protein
MNYKDFKLKILEILTLVSFCPVIFISRSSFNRFNLFRRIANKRINSLSIDSFIMYRLCQ